MRLLILAGADEARQIVQALSTEPRLRMTVSLGRAERQPNPFGIPIRIGRFGGDEAFAAWLETHGTEAVLDATHAFSVNVSWRTARICGELGIPYLQFLRPVWLPRQGDRWTFLNEESEAARHIEAGARVLVATGHNGVTSLANLRQQDVYWRVEVEPDEPFPLPSGRWLVSAPPFDIGSEKALFQTLGIDWMIVRNSGGSRSRAKLDAARALGIRVAMVRRPLQPEGPRAESVAEALAWVRRKL